MPNSQLYTVFLIKGNSTEGAVFLFKFKQDPAFRPHLGDSITNPITLENFKVMRDEVNETEEIQIRFTDDGNRRITSTGDLRIIQLATNIATVTHDYYVTPANNPNRISSWTTNKFADDQTLRQLFR